MIMIILPGQTPVRAIHWIQIHNQEVLVIHRELWNLHLYACRL